MFEKQFNHRTHETSLGPVDIEGPVPSQTLATYTLDSGLTAFRPPTEQHQALVEIADLEEDVSSSLVKERKSSVM